MPYSTVNEVKDMLKSDAHNVIIDNEYIDDPAVRDAKLIPLITDAIEDADGEIDGYLAKRYPVPLSPVPKVINKFSKDIAIYNLYSRAGLDEDGPEKNYLTRYKAAIRFLENVAKGLIDIGTGAIDTTKKAATGFKVISNNRLFNRDTLRGM